MSTCSTVQFINIYGSKISNSYILDGSYCTKSKIELNPISNPLDFTVIYPGQLAFAHFEPLELRKLGQIFFPLVKFTVLIRPSFSSKSLKMSGYLILRSRKLGFHISLANYTLFVNEST